MIKGTGQRLIPRKLLEWIKGLNKGEGASLNITTLTDSNGNPRFIEGDGTLTEITGITYTYNKWSLSGTHLMIVLGMTIANNTEITNNTKFVEYKVPSYILDKVFALYGTRINRVDFSGWSSAGQSQTLNLGLVKNSDSLSIEYIQTASTTMSSERTYRIQFDLLIDTE